MEDIVEVSMSPGVIGDQHKGVTPTAWQEPEDDRSPVSSKGGEWPDHTHKQKPRYS